MTRSPSICPPSIRTAVHAPLLLSTALVAMTLPVLPAPAAASPATASPTTANPAAAGPAGSDESHYTADVASCGGQRLRLDLARNPTGEPNLRVFWHIDGARVQGRDWHLPAEALDGAPVILDRLAGHPKAHVEGLGTPNPRVIMLGHDQTPIADCPMIALDEAEAPLARHADLLATFARIEDITPEHLADWLAAEDALPPAAMLPPLDRAALPREIASRRDELLAGLDRHVAAVPYDDSVAVSALVGDLRALWIAHPHGDHASAVLELVRATQTRRAIARLVAGEIMGDVRLTSDDTTCRIMALTGRSMMANDYVPVDADALLELASGQPLMAWTRATADAQLDEARRCAALAHAQLVAREWPRIEASVAGVALLLSWAKERAALPATLAAHDATGWLSDAPTPPTGAGLSHRGFPPLTEALTASLVASAAERLGAELAQGVDALTDPEVILSHCRSRIATTRAPAGSALAEASLTACEARAAIPLRTAAEAMIAHDLAAVEAAPETLDGLLATDGYAVAPQMDRWLNGPRQEGALVPIRTALAEVRNAMDARRDAVLTAEAGALDARMAALDPARDDHDALPDCAFYDHPRRWMAPLLGHCKALRAKFSARQTEIHCQRLFNDAEAPEAMRMARIDLGGGVTVALRVLACEWGLEAELDPRGGLISARRHDLTLQIGIQEAPLVLTGRLEAPDAEALGGDASSAPWRLTDIAVTPGRLAKGLDPDAPATLRQCLDDPVTCTE